MEIEIKAQEFRQWLEKQPDERTWDYADIGGCVICAFVKETAIAPNVSSGGYGFRAWGNNVDDQFSYTPIPKWLFGVIERTKLESPECRWLKASTLKKHLNALP